MRTPDHRRSTDVAIIGAGPAGAALAIDLVDAGRSVVLLEATAFDGARVGESLPPAVQPLLQRLDVWTDVQASRPLPSWGTRSLWGGPNVESSSHLLAPYQQGWHVDRRAFDEILALAAERRGARLCCNTRVRGAEYESDRWSIITAEGAILGADVLVDATGRVASLARSLGARRCVFDHLVGVGRPWDSCTTGENHVLVEAIEDGWWYSAPLPNGGLITLLMTDADICRSRHLTDPDLWDAALRRTSLTSRRVGEATGRGRVLSHAAYSARLLRTDPRPWLAVGDAALSVDPITGSGVTRALRTAEAAADTILRMLDRSTLRRSDAIHAYETARNRECHAYLHERVAYYAAGPDLDSPFWARRHEVHARRARLRRSVS